MSEAAAGEMKGVCPDCAGTHRRKVLNRATGEYHGVRCLQMPHYLRHLNDLLLTDRLPVVRYLARVVDGILGGFLSGTPRLLQVRPQLSSCCRNDWRPVSGSPLRDCPVTNPRSTRRFASAQVFGGFQERLDQFVSHGWTPGYDRY